MRLKCIKAEDTTKALKLVRETLGLNAVVLSTKMVNGEVEIIAASDYDETLLRDGAELSSLMKDSAELEIGPNAANPSVNTDNAETVSNEVRLLRDMIESQLAGLSWQGISSHNPLQVIILKKLIQIGFNVETAELVVQDVHASMSESDAWAAVKSKLSSSLEFSKRDLVEMGGAYFFIGPTGVGKTTTIAKIAARFSLKHGAEHCGLITLDNSRIAAYQQLSTFGNLLRINVVSCQNLQELNLAMKKMQDKKLILIDSSGFNPTSDRLSKTLSLVNQSDFPIEPIMVLSATTQTTILVKALTEYQYLPSKRVILTKTDETFSIASALCALLKAKAPLLYLSNGQQIPEDISLANHYQLFSLLNNSLSNVSEDSSLALKELMSSLIKGDNNVQL